MDVAGITKRLSDIFAVPGVSVSALSPLSDGISNSSYLFRIGEAAYVVRVPVGDVVEREKLESERMIYLELAKHGVRGVDELVYFDAEDGIKITRYIEGARYPDESDPVDIGRCVNLLRNIHESGVIVGSAFDLMERFLKDEQRVSAKASPDEHMNEYGALRAEAIAAYDGLKDVFAPSFNHIDPIKYNFLFTRERDYLIDFEYAGMASPMIDIAAFAVYHRLSVALVDGLMNSYLGHAPSSVEKKSLYRYLALEGLFSALWYLERLDEGVGMKNNMDQCYRCARQYVREALG